MMNRNNRQLPMDRMSRDGRANFGMGMGMGLGDGLLGEGPLGGGGGGGPMMGSNPMMGNNPMMGGNPLGLNALSGFRDTQLALAQTLLQQQQQQLVNAGFGGSPDFGQSGALGAFPGSMNLLQQQQMRSPHSLMGGMHNERKRSGGYMRRDHDEKRGRRDSYGRGESHGSRTDRNKESRDSAKDRKRDEDYDPAEPTEDDEEKNTSGSKDTNLHCHVCNVSVYDEESLKRHLNGLKHKARMESIASVNAIRVPQLQMQVNPRLQAQEHLRNIERKGGRRNPDFFCKICNNDLTIPWEKHRYSNIHKQRNLQVKKGCGWCDVHNFTNFSQVLEHRETEQHKKNALLYGKKDEEDDGSRKRLKDGKESEDDKEEDEEEDLTIPEYDPEVPVGLNYVIPVTGYFCKLCHKFYNKKSARAAHCVSEAHYAKFKEATEIKIAEKEKREEEARLRKEMEEAEAKENAADQNGHGDDIEDENMEEEEAVEEEQEEGGEEEEAGGEDVDQSGAEVGEEEAMVEDEEMEGDQGDLNEGSWVGGPVDTSSFVYLSGDKSDNEALEGTVEDDSIADGVSAELSSASIDQGAGDDNLDLSTQQEDNDAVTTSTPVAADSKSAVRGKGTAKRGRGRRGAKK